MMRIIGYLDMDAFFAAVEERDNPRFAGLPIVVGSDPKNGQGRGVVSTANYKAREYGIKSATPITKAWQFSENAKRQGKPAAIFLPVDFEKYGRTSQRIFGILKKYARLIEPASIDEFCFDLSFAETFKKGREIALQIKDAVKNQEKLTCSIGVGPNKLIAKIASDFQKPDGLTIVPPEKAENFLAPLPVRKIPGIGPKTEIVFSKLGAKKVSDLKKYSEGELYKMLGQWGLDIYEKIRGLDETPLVFDYEAKSIGQQETFEKDTLDSKIIFPKIEEMAEELILRLKTEGFHKFKTIAITVRFSGFETKTRAKTLGKPADSLDLLKFESLRLLTPFFDRRENPQQKLIRMIGLRLEKLS
ncbi:MAG: DNA polymerase IV [Candidatus Portnoybacteria bacterium]|nr:DNA polymerase IV [Candidatus Portnoybacteria bacterium]